MKEHLRSCIDLVETLDDTTLVQGWCLASDRIVSIAVFDTDGAEVVSGLERPDVAAAFPGYPDATSSGFRARIPGRPGEELRLRLLLEDSAGQRRERAGVLFLDHDGVQLSGLGEERHFSEHLDPELESKLAESLADDPGILLRLDLVNRCQLRCAMCHYGDPDFARGPRRELGLDELRELVDSLGPQLWQVMLSCADEPLLSRQFPDVVSWLADAQPHVHMSFCTNGMLLRPEIQRLIVDQGVARIAVSLDGVRKATLESIRIGARYETIVRHLVGLAAAKEAAGTQYPLLTLNYVMMGSNVHEAPLFVEMASRLGADAIDFRHVIPSDHFCDPGQLLHHQPERFNHYRARILERAQQLGIQLLLPESFETDGAFTPPADEPVADLSDFEAAIADFETPSFDPPPRARLPEDFEDRYRERVDEHRYAEHFCDRPFTEMTIADQNAVKPCPFHRFPLATVGEGRSLREIFYGEEFQRLRQNMLRPWGDIGCQGCPIQENLLAVQRNVDAEKTDTPSLPVLVSS